MSAEEVAAPSSACQSFIPLQQSLDSCCKAIEAGDFRKSEDSISEISELLGSISDAVISDPDDDTALNNATAVLSHIQSYLFNPSLDQGVIDALSFELPKAIAKFAGVSPKFSEIVDSIIDLFTTKCSPRDMISVFCEALDAFSKTTDAPGYVASLLYGASKVFLSIQRRPLEQIKVAVPIILHALEAASFDLDNGDAGLKDLFGRAIDVANSIQSTCKKLEGVANEQLRALLGLYVLQVMTIISITMGDEVAICLHLIQNLSHFFPYCGLSYADIVAGQGVDPLAHVVCGDDTNDFKDCFSYIKHGAVLSVIWGYIFVIVAHAAEQDLEALKDELRSMQRKRWSAIGMLKYIFSLGKLPFTIKKHAISFLLDITENIDQQELNEDTMCSSLTPSIISSLQGIMSVVMNAPDAVLRKNAMVALKRVLADNPPSLRLDMMQVLVSTCSSSSMKALILDYVRENLRNDYRKLQEGKICSSSSFWDSGVLDLVELVLRPPDGGPPSLPEQSDAVLSALNLYRYVLVTESTGKTNYTGVASRSNLQKAYNEWLLPLRTLVSGIVAQNEDEYDQLAVDIVCALNPVELVLYRCIELVEEKLKQLP